MSSITSGLIIQIKNGLLSQNQLYIYKVEFNECHSRSFRKNKGVKVIVSSELIVMSFLLSVNV